MARSRSSNKESRSTRETRSSNSSKESRSSNSSKDNRSSSSSRDNRSASSSRDNRSASSSRDNRSSSSSRDNRSVSSSRDNRSSSSSKDKRSTSSSRDKNSSSLSRDNRSANSSRDNRSASSSRDNRSASSSKEKRSASSSRDKRSASSSKGKYTKTTSNNNRISTVQNNKRTTAVSNSKHTATSQNKNRTAAITNTKRTTTSNSKHSVTPNKNRTVAISNNKRTATTPKNKQTVTTSNNKRITTAPKQQATTATQMAKYTQNTTSNRLGLGSLDSRFVASLHMVSDKQNKIDYSLSTFSEKIREAAQLVSKNKKIPNKKERSPFSGKYVTTREINHELKQAKLAIDKIPNNNLSKTIAKNSLINLIDEAGKKLLQNNNDLGYILTTSTKKFNAADHISNLFELVNYVSNDKMDKANEKLTDTAGTLAGAYAAAKIGAQRGKLLSVGLGAVFSAIGGTKEGRELLTNTLFPSENNFKQGEFDNLENYAIQAEKIKQEMSMFNDKARNNSDINPPSIIFDSPIITQDGTK